MGLNRAVCEDVVVEHACLPHLFTMQVLVYHDLLGMMQHPHHAKVTPKFCKQYGNVGEVVQQALQQYRAEVMSGAFPSEQYSPYKLGSESETADFAEQLDAAGFANAATAVINMSKNMEPVRDTI